VGLAGLILDDSGDKVESVAVVVRAGIDHVDHIEAAESFSRGDLGGINGGRRFVDIDGLADFLLAGESHFDDGSAGDLHVGLIDRVEAFFFDVNVVRTGGEGGKLAAAVEIGEAVESRLGGGGNGNAGIPDGDAGVVDYDDDGRGCRLGRGGADQDESDQGSTHAVVRRYLTFGCGDVDAGFLGMWRTGYG
jgi:hypothetical protein